MENPQDWVNKIGSLLLKVLPALPGYLRASQYLKGDKCLIVQCFPVSEMLSELNNIAQKTITAEHTQILWNVYGIINISLYF